MISSFLKTKNSLILSVGPVGSWKLLIGYIRPMSQGLQNTDLWDYTELIFCHFDNILYCINKSAEDKESLVRTETCAEEMS